MKRDLVRIVVNGMLLAGLIGPVRKLLRPRVPGKPCSKQSVQPATDRMGKVKCRWERNLAPAT
jgi:hypothetical protein